MSDIFIKIKKQVLLRLKKVWIFLWFSDHRWETPPATVNAYYNPARNQISKPQAHFLFVIFIAYTLSTCYVQYVAVNYMFLHHSWTVSSFIHIILYGTRTVSPICLPVFKCFLLEYYNHRFTRTDIRSK